MIDQSFNLMPIILPNSHNMNPSFIYGEIIKYVNTYMKTSGSVYFETYATNELRKIALFNKSLAQMHQVCVSDPSTVHGNVVGVNWEYRDDGLGSLFVVLKGGLISTSDCKPIPVIGTLHPRVLGDRNGYIVTGLDRVLEGDVTDERICV